MNIFASRTSGGANNDPTCYFKVYDISGTTAILIADGSGHVTDIKDTDGANPSIVTPVLYVPSYTLADLTHRIRVDLYAIHNGKNATFYFRGPTQSHIHTTIVGSAGLQGPPGPTGQSISWIAGGTYAETNAGITASNTLITTSDAITPSSTTARYLIMGSVTSITGVTAGSFYGTLARGLGITGQDSINLANSQAISDGITGITGHMVATHNATNANIPYTLAMSVVDQPGTTGTYYYSLWVYSDSETSDPQNSMLTVLQVAP
jgi:hypothetical protein